MNSIQSICFDLSFQPINGFFDNELCESVKKDINEAARELSFWDLIFHASKVEVETCHDFDEEDIVGQNRMHQALFYFPGVEAPLKLDLMPAHPAFPTFPKQLFKVSDKKEGGLEVIDNPYYSGSLAEVYNFTLALYVALSKLTGYKEPSGGKVDFANIIKKVTLNAESRTIEIERCPKLKAEVLDAQKEQISSTLRNAQEQELTRFLEQFMKGMIKKSIHAPKAVIVEGRQAIQNHFEPGEWSSKELMLPLKEVLGELSFDSSPDCPAYVSHYVRLLRYVKERLPSITTMSMPINEREHGIDSQNWDEFLSLPASKPLLEHYESELLGMLDSMGMTLGRLLDAYQMISKAE